MSRRTPSLIVGALLLAGTTVCILAAVLIYLAAGVNDNGSPELAAEWKAMLATLAASADDVQTQQPELERADFPGGDWVIGFAQNSHGLFVRGGGTLVVKDSRGDVRAFFGHVCGPHFLKTFFRDTPDLDRFYARLRHLNFTEHTFP